MQTDKKNFPFPPTQSTQQRQLLKTGLGTCSSSTIMINLSILKFLLKKILITFIHILHQQLYQAFCKVYKRFPLKSPRLHNRWSIEKIVNEVC